MLAVLLKLASVLSVYFYVSLNLLAGSLWLLGIRTNEFFTDTAT